MYAITRKLLGNQENKIRTALDLGTGTGLLAITAATLGVEKIIAIDHNSFACTLARSNIELNQLAKQITVTQLDLQSKMPDTGVDLVIANLYKGLLEQIMQHKEFWHASYYIFSGFIPRMEPDHSLYYLRTRTCGSSNVREITSGVPGCY